MSTRVQLSREYPHAVSSFAAALTDPAFHRTKLDVDGSGQIEVVEFSRDHGADGSERVGVVLLQPVPPGRMPAVVERLLSGVLVIRRTERWRLAADRCDGRTEVVVPRTPIGAVGRMSVEPSGTGSRLSVDISVTASVPLVGAGIEWAVLTGIRGLTGKEHERISTWLDAVESGSAHHTGDDSEERA